MLTPQIDKVTVNISVGQSGAPLERATKVLQQLTGQRPCERRAKRTVRDFGIHKGAHISCSVTLRGAEAAGFLRKALQAVENRVKSSSFDRRGNFSFGIKEHIDMPGTRYMPELGIFGMDVCVTLGRRGYRVSRRRRARSRIGKRHRLTPEEAKAFVHESFGVEILGDAA